MDKNRSNNVSSTPEEVPVEIAVSSGKEPAVQEKSTAMKKEPEVKSTVTKVEQKRSSTGLGGDPVTQINEGHIATMLYDQLMGIFGEGTQLFTMEVPGRVLNPLDFSYPMINHNSSTITKPYAVIENEFRLSDNLVDVAPIVQGPNGKRLSSTFDTLLNNYTPDISDIKDFIIDKMELRLFLLEEITDEVDGEEVTCSRVEFCQRVYLKYLKEKYNWDQEKIDQHLKATEVGDLDGYAKWLATAAWTKDQQLENLFQDAVTRGFYHEILTILGFLDVSSPAERLAQTKANKRSSVRRSLDGSMDVLPVQFQPSNWFRSISPNFSPMDLTLDPMHLSEQYKVKQKLLSSLEAELRIMAMHNSDDAEIQILDANVKELKAELEEQEVEAFKLYSTSAVEAMKLVFEIWSGGDIAGFVSKDVNPINDLVGAMNVEFKETLFPGMGDGNQIADLANRMYELYKANKSYFSTYNQLVDAELEYAKSRANDYGDQMEILKERITVTSRELNELEVIMASGVTNTKGNDQIADGLLPGSLYNESSEYMDIIFKKSELKSKIESKDSSSFNSVSAAFGMFFVNASASGKASLASTKFMHSVFDSEFTMALRATKVTFDRGGWFDPGILELTPFYRRLKENLMGGAGLTVEDILNSYSKNIEMINGAFSATSKLTKAPGNATYTLLAYPTSFLIVKDIVIKTSLAELKEEDFQEFKKIAYSVNASIGGIRLSGGGAVESSIGTHMEDDNTMSFVMRIPGPQILGWFQQMVPKDISQKYESLSQSEYFNDMIDALKVYSEKLKELKNTGTDDGDYVSVTTVNVPRE